MTSIRSGLFLLAALATFAASAIPARAPARDLGRLSASSPVSATVALKLRNTGQLESLVASLYNRGSPSYHQFISADEFRARFAPDAASVGKVASALQRQGLSVEVINGTFLRVTGPSAAVERAFGVELRSFQAAGARFHAPSGAPKASPEIAAEVESIVGLDTRPRFHSNLRRAPAALRPTAVRPATSPPNTPDAPGLWTVTDLAQYYDVSPLYQRGVTGKGRTIGIVTLAAFTPSDAFAYWKSLGLKVDPNRIQIVDIDGGPGAPSDASGSDETTLDVEQSGGLAPGAKIIVYQAPNTDQGFLDAFASAISHNHADAVSCSWGTWEEFLVQGTAISDPNAAGQLRAYHNLFLQAALQGQSLSAAAGDAGAYDANDSRGPFPLPQFTQVLSVDHPASDSFMCAAGGTTLPGEQDFLLPDGSTFVVNVAHERAWSWDYLTGLCNALGFDPISCGIFPVGTGGGVSVVFPVPFYQDGLDGIARSEPKQVLTDTSQSPPQTLVRLPSRFEGRNLPDISLNADPETGYTIFYTSDQTGFAVGTFGGGTSFVAPQLAGISVLIDQDAGGRIGLLNFALYELAWTGLAYSGRHPPLRDIRNGNNDFYSAVTGYDRASGLGVLDVANLAALFR